MVGGPGDAFPRDMWRGETATRGPDYKSLFASFSSEKEVLALL
jgi:hypothetical protein